MQADSDSESLGSETADNQTKNNHLTQFSKLKLEQRFTILNEQLAQVLAANARQQATIDAQQSAMEKLNADNAELRHLAEQLHVQRNEDVATIQAESRKQLANEIERQKAIQETQEASLTHVIAISLHKAFEKNDAATFKDLTNKYGVKILQISLASLNDQTLLQYAILQGYHLSSNRDHQQIVENMISHVDSKSEINTYVETYVYSGTKELYGALQKNDSGNFAAITEKYGPAIFLTPFDDLDYKTLLQHAILAGYHLSSNTEHQKIMQHMMSYANQLASKLNLKDYIDQYKLQLNKLLAKNASSKVPYIMNLFRMHRYGSQVSDISGHYLSEVSSDKIKIGQLTVKQIDERLIIENTLNNDVNNKFPLKTRVIFNDPGARVTTDICTPIIPYNSKKHGAIDLNKFIDKAIKLTTCLIPSSIYENIQCGAMKLYVQIDLRLSLRRGWCWLNHSDSTIYHSSSDVFYQFDVTLISDDKSMKYPLFSSVFKFTPENDPLNFNGSNKSTGSTNYQAYHERHDGILRNFAAYAKGNWQHATFLQATHGTCTAEEENLLRDYLTKNIKESGKIDIKNIEELYPQTCKVVHRV